MLRGLSTSGRRIACGLCRDLRRLGPAPRLMSDPRVHVRSPTVQPVSAPPAAGGPCSSARGLMGPRNTASVSSGRRTANRSACDWYAYLSVTQLLPGVRLDEVRQRDRYGLRPHAGASAVYWHALTVGGYSELTAKSEPFAHPRGAGGKGDKFCQR